MSILKVLLLAFFLVLFTTGNSQSQRNISQRFFTGYYAAPPHPLERWNNMYVERRDTGLYFSERIYSNYDFQVTQTATLCDTTGTPLLLWQGCAILDPATMQPIENGDFSNTIGTKSATKYNFCGKTHWPTDLDPDSLTRTYSITYSTFFLERGNPRDILLVYYRYLDQEQSTIDSFYIYTAAIDLSGGENQKPRVKYKDSLAVGPINLRFGSIHAVRHANGKDWWIVFAENYTANWYSALYDGDGVHTPLRSVISEWDLTNYNDGISAVSPNGKLFAMIALQENRFLLLNFDRCEGIYTYKALERIPAIDAGTAYFRNIEFSPTGRYLYVNTPVRIFRYDTEADDIHSSGTMVARFDTSKMNDLPWEGYISMPIRGFDGKMYYWSLNGVRRIHRIAYPDAEDPAAVGWTQDYYTTPIYIPWMIPTLIDYDMGPLLGVPCTGAVHTGAQRQDWPLYPNPTSSMVRCDAVPDTYLQEQLEILDSRGQSHMQFTGAELLHGISVALLPPGVYIIKTKDSVLGRFVRIE